MKLQELFIVGLVLVSITSTSILAADERSKRSAADSQEKLALEAAQEHTMAAEQLEEAAAHHRKVAEFYRSGKLEDAGWNAYMADAHCLRAQQHITNAALLHLTEKRNLSDRVNPAEPK